MTRAAIISLLIFSSASVWADSITVTTTTTTTTTVDADPVFEPPAQTPQTTDAAHTARDTRTTPDFRVTVAGGPALGFDTKDDCAKGECFGLHVQLGGEIAPRLLLLASGELMMAPDGKDRHHVATLSLQKWMSSRLWLEMGLGVGSKRSWTYAEPPTMDLSGEAPAGAAAVGFEALRRAGYSFGVQARVASTTDVHHTSFGQLMAAFSWY
jgi:hypothetical protein